MKIYIRKGVNASGTAYYWVTLVGLNNERLMMSETYASKASAQNVVSVIKANAASAIVYDLT